MIIKQKNDSIYVTADTLYSGRLTDMPGYQRTFLRSDSAVENSIQEAPPAEELAIPVDSTGAPLINPDSIGVAPDTIAQPILIDPSDTTNRNRYFQAYHHVRIFSDSLQAVCDSLFYSGVDSVFRLFKEPIAWASGSQVTGDTLYLYTQNKQPLRIRVFENGLMVNRTPDNFYNQLKGNTINGYFIDGNIDYVRARGSAESIYYAQDEDSAYAGVNRSTAAIIDMYFANKELNRVVFRSDVNGTMYPFRQVNHGEMRLRGFHWFENRRPKSKFELFENPPPPTE
jgi:hypothetical protein